MALRTLSAMIGGVVASGGLGAFSVNGVGIDGAQFPLSFSVREVDGSWVVDATAAQASELADLLVDAANNTIVVVDLATNSFLDEQYVQWRPSRIAAEQGVDCQVHSLNELASGVVGLSEEVLVLRGHDLPRFLAGWSPYELTLLDAPAMPTPQQLDDIALVIGTARHDEPILPALDGSRLRFSGHDDCYLAIESTDPTVPAAILSRLLALLVSSALADPDVEVPDPDVTGAATMIEENPHWIGSLGTVSEHSVTVDLTATPERWSLSQPLPNWIDRTAIYDIARGVWHLAVGPPSE